VNVCGGDGVMVHPNACPQQEKMVMPFIHIYIIKGIQFEMSHSLNHSSVMASLAHGHDQGFQSTIQSLGK
jgi:hypothetical protein